MIKTYICFKNCHSKLVWGYAHDKIDLHRKKSKKEAWSGETAVLNTLGIQIANNQCFIIVLSSTIFGLMHLYQVIQMFAAPLESR